MSGSGKLDMSAWQRASRCVAGRIFALLRVASAMVNFPGPTQAIALALWLCAAGPAFSDSRATVLHVGSETDFPPYADVDERGNPTGFSVELFSAAAAAMNIPIHFEVGHWDTIWNGLTSKRLDALPIVARGKTRDPLVEHTSVHTVGYDSFLVRKHSRAIATIEAARGKRIIVMRSDAAHHELAQRGFEDLVYAATLPEALRMLAGGQHDAVLAPIVQSTRLIRQLGLKEVEAGPPLKEYRREFTFAVSKGNLALRDQLEQGLMVIKASGEYQRIYDRWLGAYEPPSLPLKELLYAAGGVAAVLLIAATWVASLRRSRNRLRTLQEHLSFAMEASQTGTWEFDLITKVASGNRQHARIFGYEESGPPWSLDEFLRHVVEGSRDEIAARIAGGIAGHSPWSFKCPVRRADGALRWISVSGGAKYDQNGRPTRAVGIVRDITDQELDRIRVGELVREQQALLDSQVAGIARVTADMYQWVSPAFAKMLGYVPAEMLGQSTRIVFVNHGAYVRFGEEVAGALATNGTYRGECQFMRKDGSSGWYEVSGAPVSDQDDALIWSCIDISERKRYQEALRESEQHFRNLADNGSALIWTSGPDLHCDYFNIPWLRFTGRTLAQELGNGWVEGVHEADLARCLNIYTSAFEHRQPFSMDYRLRHVTGEYRWIRDDGVPRFDSSGHFLGYIGHCYDIDDSIRLRAQADEQERQYQLIFEGTPDGVLTADLATRRFVAANQSMCALLGYELSELMLMETPDIHPQDELPGILALFDRMARGEANEASGIPLRKKSGHFVYADLVVALHEFGGRKCITGFFRDITEKRRTEAKLRQLSLAVEQSADSIIITGLDAKIEYVNEGFCRNTGYSPGETLGRNPRFLSSGHTPKETFVAMWAALTEGRSWVGNVFNRAKDGSDRIDRTAITPLRDERNRITHFIAVQTDVTVQERLMEELTQHQHRLEELVAARTSELQEQKYFLEDVIGTLPVGVYRLRHRSPATASQWGDIDNPPHVQDYSSDTYCKLLGISREEAEATQGGVISRIHPADREDFLQRVETSNFTLKPFSWEGRMSINGQIRWMRFDAIPRRIDNEIVVAGIVQSIDQQRLQASLVYRSVIEASPDAFVAIDEDNRVIEWSAQAEGMFGYSADEVLGMQLTDVMIPASQAGEHEYHLRQFVANGRDGAIGRRRRVIARRRDNKEFPVELQIMALKIDGHWRFTSFVRDISDVVAAEQRLAQAQKLEAVGQLTGGLAHDFNNLLGIVAGNLDLLREGCSPDEAPELIDAALQAAKRGVGVTKSLLALARRDKLAAGPTNLDALVGELEPLLRQSAGKRAKISIQVGADNATAVVDASAFSNALINLVLNARDAMPNGGDILVYTLTTYLELPRADDIGRPELPEGLYVVVGVDDTGQGMTPEVLRKAVDPFFTTKKRDSGTGLGLAMVNAFAAQSGGTLQIDSASGKGTSARLVLPVVTANETRVAATDRSPTGAPTPAGSKRVLLVDDEQGLLKISEKWLRGLGYRVATATCAADALAALAEGKFDLLLSDVVMPGEMDGLALARNAARLYPEMRIVLASGYPENITEEDRRRWVVLEKPVSRSDFTGAVAHALEQAPGVRE